MGAVTELLKSSTRPFELWAMVSLKVSGRSRKTKNDQPLDLIAQHADDRGFSYAALNQVSRSFALVIQELPGDLKDAVCLFYLILRGLDTVEDDMDLSPSAKERLLSKFHEHIYDPEWKINGVGDTEDYRILLANFDKVIRFFLSIDEGYQKVIADITQRMAYGMAHHGESKVETIEDYDQYCHYVAGLVGHGLTELFAVSDYESPTLVEELELANSMGLFLQKTNIIRDYYEDLESGRLFWPREIWTRYADEIGEFAQYPNAAKSMACLNHMVTDAMRHADDCLSYMSKLQHKQVFKFCAIPQVMAIGTLAEVYNNPKTFTSVVKIRKGMTASLIKNTKDAVSLQRTFCYFADKMKAKADRNDPNYLLMIQRLESILSRCKSVPQKI